MWLGLPRLRLARGEGGLRSRLFTPYNSTASSPMSQMEKWSPRRHNHLSWPQGEPSRAGARTLVCPAPGPTAHALPLTAALSKEKLPSSREPSLVTWWLVRFLCLCPCTGLIRSSHNFLMVQLPPPSDWEFLWGWGQHQAMFPAGAQRRV